MQGPLALFPSSALDSVGWLEAELRITLRHGKQKMESISVFVDSTLNRDAGFLPPMLRHAFWDRQQDMAGTQQWPTLQVKLGKVKTQAAVHDGMVALQQAAQGISFAGLGLSLQRDMPVLNTRPELPGYEIYLCNGPQKFEYQSPMLADDPFSTLVLSSFADLCAQLQEVDKSGWRERYARNLELDYPHDYWEWEYGEIR